MRIAVPCDNPGGPISQQFGRSRYFCIYDSDTGQRQVVENPGGTAMRRAGVLAANFLVQQGVNAVVALSVGPNSSRILQAAGVDIYLTRTTDINAAIQEYLASR